MMFYYKTNRDGKYGGKAMNGVILPAMKEKKVRILGIAPYTGMKSTMEHIARERADLKLDVYIGDLDQGVHIALNNIQSNYDILISRGGTASLLEKESSLPVVTVEISTYDILRTIKLCENYSQPLAIVGFPNVTANAHADRPKTVFLYFSDTCVPAARPIENRQSFVTA